MALDYTLRQTHPGIKRSLGGPRWWPWYWPEFVGWGIELTATGERGCGKTTLLELAADIVRQNGGKVRSRKSRPDEFDDDENILVASLDREAFPDFGLKVQVAASRINRGIFDPRELTRGMGALVVKGGA
ncbi:MAG: hypothetical protein H7Y60_09160 [Rhodospirillaceae bacterium]|nr:hypothetical protein [Rhodospirillales bacterium]